MRTIVVALLALGCAAPPHALITAAPPVAPAIRANAWFASVRSHADLAAIPGRAWLAPGTRASLDRRTWNVVAPRPADPDPCDVIAVPVVARSGDAAQIVADTGGVLMTLWLDADDLVPVVRRATPLWVAPPAAGDVPSGRVHVGEPVRVQERRGDYARVVIEHGSEVARGWVAADDLDAVALPLALPASGRVAAPQAPWTQRRLLAAPASDAVELGGNGFLARLSVIDEAGPWTHVRYAGAGFDLDGWVETTALQRRLVDFDDHAGCGPRSLEVERPIGRRYFGPEAERHRTLAIPRGTCLWASPHGPVVAVATADAARDFRRADDGAWWTTAIDTRWGTFAVGLPMDRDAPAVPSSTCDDAGAGSP